MGHKTDMRRYAKSIDTVARSRINARRTVKPPVPVLSPEAQMLKEGLGHWIVSDEGRERTYLVAQF